jgi:hypothetical protein
MQREQAIGNAGQARNRVSYLLSSFLSIVGNLPLSDDLKVNLLPSSDLIKQELIFPPIFKFEILNKISFD